MKKTSKKILIIAFGFITVLLIGSMIIIRDDIETLFTTRTALEGFKPFAVEKFERIDFSANWSVTIKQGPGYKLEIANKDSSATKLRIYVENKTLYFSVDTIQSTSTPENIKVRITTPSLKSITSMKGTRIHLSNIIQDGCVVTGTDTSFKFVSFKSSGDTRIELRATPDF
jgi:hypothetical protein